MRILKDLSLNGKKVLIRADLNVPLDENRNITDDTRIKGFLPTLKAVIDSGGSAIVMSHLGEPANDRDDKFSLKPVFEYLKKHTPYPINFANSCIGNETENLASNLEPGQVLLLENLRFFNGEKKNDPEFAKQLAKLGEVFISDAFGTCHRVHASMVGVPALFTEKGAGLLIEKELNFFDKALNSPARPLCIVLGGAKVSSKLDALINIADKADKLIIGGAMANTFLAAQGLQMGRSLYEPELANRVLELLGRLARRRCLVYLPVDLIVAPSLTAKGLGRAVPSAEVPADTMALDIGPATRILYQEALVSTETIVWNGPMGAFENEEFAEGTNSMVGAVASAHALTLVGGGDTDVAIHQMELAHKFDWISTGGGAFLALLEGKALPGIAAL
jgi:phosphoglycerate kinase